MKKIKKIFCLVLLLTSLASVIYAENDNSLLIRGLEAYKQKDWTTALFFLRKASTLPENLTPETWYVLIMAEVYASDFESVLTDGKVDIAKLRPITYDGLHHGYYVLGEKVGNAYEEGQKLK